jgi:hypothetical protein
MDISDRHQIRPPYDNLDDREGQDPAYFRIEYGEDSTDPNTNGPVHSFSAQTTENGLEIERISRSHNDHDKLTTGLQVTLFNSNNGETRNIEIERDSLNGLLSGQYWTMTLGNGNDINGWNIIDIQPLAPEVDIYHNARITTDAT